MLSVAEGSSAGAAAARGRRYPSSKFATPKGPVRLVHRSRLFEQLDQGADVQLTLVVGSPGAGKTVLLSDWLAANPDRASVWLSCDVADGGPGPFRRRDHRGSWPRTAATRTRGRTLASC